MVLTVNNKFIQCYRKPDGVLDRINNFKTCSVLKHWQFYLPVINYRLPTCHFKLKAPLTFLNSVNVFLLSYPFLFVFLLAYLVATILLEPDFKVRCGIH